MRNEPATTLLLVEHSPADVRMTKQAFRSVKPSIQLHAATDGAEATAFLGKIGCYVDARRPDVILRGLNLPDMDGREILLRIKSDDGLKMIPTVILSTSTSEADITHSYEVTANCYRTKPVHQGAFETPVKSIDDFWLTKATLPKQRPSSES
jgi:two-component system, chemotaxis family, response regulator Rcp1